MQNRSKLSIVKPSVVPTMKNGNIYSGKEFLAELLDDEQVSEIKAHSLSLLRMNSWEALEELGIDTHEIIKTVEYKCPFRKDTVFYRLYPLYISRLYPNEVSEWNKIFVEEDPKLDTLIRSPFVNQVDKTFIGHGLSYYSMGMNGSGEWKWAKINLSDKRWLLVQCFIWYSK